MKKNVIFITHLKVLGLTLALSLMTVNLSFSQASVDPPDDGGTPTSCTSSVGCSSNPNDYVSCTGSSCERDGMKRSVTCDGVVTTC